MTGVRAAAITVLLMLFAGGISLASPRETANGVDASISVEQVIDKYVEACGGTKLSKIESEVRKGTLLRGASGKTPLTIEAKTGGRWYYNQVFAWGDQISFGFDGSNAWIQDTNGTEEMDRRQQLDFQLMLDVHAPLKIRELYPEMEIAGTEKVGDRDAVSILATSRDGVLTRMAFDSGTGLLLRAGAVYFEDYRDIGDIKRPYRILLGTDEGERHLQMKMEFADIRHNVEVDDTLFEPSDCSLPVKDAPLYKRRKHVMVAIEDMEACVGIYRVPDKPGIEFTVTRQGKHLMIEPKRLGVQFEIKPESPTDYYVEFFGWEFHFAKDPSGKIAHLETADGTVKADRIE